MKLSEHRLDAICFKKMSRLLRNKRDKYITFAQNNIS